YIRFAKEEKELFKLLYMCDRQGAPIPESADLFNRMEAMVHHNTGLHSPEARLFHLEMWAYVHGIATMTATGFCHLDRELISKMLTDAYLGMKKHYGLE
ncbi:MAG TPA: TetR-like C-terminal domain-containing protein, partial [Methanocorpusculum sp.]|nr:TetR-like C-terminal domain-containing protein [Methanocorpusculum sp.]